MKFVELFTNVIDSKFATSNQISGVSKHRESSIRVSILTGGTGFVFEIIFKVLWLSIQGAGFLFAVIFFTNRIYKEIRAMQHLKGPLSELNRRLGDQPLDQDIDQIFEGLPPVTKYYKQWKRYYERSCTQDTDDRLRVDPYLGAEPLMYHMGYRAWMDMLPGLFVSFGVLGTFIGLSMGLSGLSNANVDAMKSGIFVLLGGMKAAFFTSIAGIASGFLWSFLDRKITSRLEQQVDWHSERLVILLNPDEEELFLQRMEKMAKHQAEHLKTILTDALEQAMRPAFAGLQAGIQSQSEIMEKQLQVTLRQSADITEQLVENITGGTKEAIDRFDGMVMTTFDMQDRMLVALNDVVAKFTETGAAHHEMMGTIQNTSQALNEQMVNVVGNLETTTEDMRQVSEDMVMIGERLKNMQDHVEQMQSIEERLLPQLMSLREDTTEVMKDLLDQSKEHVTEMSQHVANLNENWKSANKVFQDTSQTLRTSVQEWSEHITEKWQAASDAFEATNRTLSTSMKDFSENVDQGLSKTYIHFDHTLTDAMRKVRELIEQLNGLYNELYEGAEEIAHSVSQIPDKLNPLTAAEVASP